VQVSVTRVDDGFFCSESPAASKAVSRPTQKSEVLPLAALADESRVVT